MASLYKKTVFVRDPKSGLRVKSKSKKWWGRFNGETGAAAFGNPGRCAARDLARRWRREPQVNRGERSQSVAMAQTTSAVRNGVR